MEETYRFNRLEIFIRPNNFIDPNSRSKWVCNLHFTKSWVEEKKQLDIDLKLEIVNEDIVDLIEEAKNLITTKNLYK